MCAYAMTGKQLADAQKMSQTQDTNGDQYENRGRAVSNKTAVGKPVTKRKNAPKKNKTIAGKKAPVLDQELTG